MSKEKMKAIALTVVLALIALVLIGVLVVDTLKQNGTIVNDEQKGIMTDFDKYYNSKERTVIYYASTSCSWCALLSPTLETISKDYDMDYYYVDTSKLGAKQRNEIMEKLEIEKHATPITVVVENGKVISKQEGYVDGKEYVKFFIEAGMIPEDAVYSTEQYITFIDYDKYEELITKGSHIVVIGQTTCSHCIAIKPALNSVARDYDVTINYLNLTEMTQSESSAFFKSLETLGYDDEEFLETGGIGTPLVLMIKNGKISSHFSGERTKSQLVREFTKAGFISE